MLASRNSPQIPIRRDADQQLMVNLDFDLEFRVALEVLSHNSLTGFCADPRGGRKGSRQVALQSLCRAPRSSCPSRCAARSLAIRPERSRECGCYRGILHARPAIRPCPNRIDNLERNDGARNHRDTLKHRRFARRAIVSWSQQRLVFPIQVTT